MSDSRKIIACATVRGPNTKFASHVSLGKVYRPGDEVPADLTDEVRMKQLFEAGVLRYDGQLAVVSEPESKVQLGTSKEDGPELALKSVDDSGRDAQLDAIASEQAQARARGEKVGAELDAEMRAKEAVVEAEEAAEAEQRTVTVNAQTGEVEDSGADADDGDEEIRVSD